MEWPVASMRQKPFKMADDIQRKAYLFQLNQANKISDTTLLADADLDQEDENEIMIRETALRIRAMEKQQLALAELGGKQQVIMMKQTAKAQQEMQAALAAPPAPGEPGGPNQPGGQALNAVAPLAQMQSPLSHSQNMGMNSGPEAGNEAMLGGTNILALASRYAAELSQMDPASQHLTLKQLRAQSPELADLVLQFLAGMNGGMAQQTPLMPANANAAAAARVDMRPLPEQRAPRRAAVTV